jgi:hypothetical protein
MDKYKVSARIIVLVIVVLVIIAGIVFHDVTIGGENINDVYKNNPGKIWFITGIGTLTFSMLMYLVFISVGALEKLMEVINSKNDLIESQGNQIIAHLQYNAKTQSDIMHKLNKNTEHDIQRDKMLIDHRDRIEKIEKHIGL